MGIGTLVGRVGLASGGTAISVPVPGIVVCLVVLVGGSFFLGRELGWLEAAEARQDLTNLVDED